MRFETGRYQLLNQQKYDLTYQNSIGAVVLGNILIVINIIVLLMFNVGQQQYLMFAIPLRMVVSAWSAITAARQNRYQLGWFICGLILPALALILLGSIKKLRIQVKIDTAANEEAQYKELTKIARKLAIRRKYQESIDVYNYIVAKLPHNEQDVKMQEQLIEQLSNNKRSGT